MKILTVEDNEINARLVDIILKDLEFDIEHVIAEDADAAFRVTSDAIFDLILMDINLGHGQMEGTEVMKILKKKEEFKETPMYAVTCYSLPGDKERFLAEGFDKYFSKPIDHNKLLEAVSTIKHRLK